MPRRPPRGAGRSSVIVLDTIRGRHSSRQLIARNAAGWPLYPRLTVTDTGIGMDAEVMDAYVRAVLHHQGRRTRHRTWAGQRARHRHAGRRRTLTCAAGAVRVSTFEAYFPQTEEVARDDRASDRGLPPAASWRGARPSCSWMMKTPLGRARRGDAGLASVTSRSVFRNEHRPLWLRFMPIRSAFDLPFDRRGHARHELATELATGAASPSVRICRSFS